MGKNLSAERKALLLGGFLHDIGKFQYRAEKTTDVHQVNSAYFIREKFNRFPCLSDCLEMAVETAGLHHDEVGDKDLKAADHLTASDRISEENRQARRPLISVFSRIENIKKGMHAPEEVYFIKPEAVNSDTIFPINGGVALKEWKIEPKDVMDWHKGPWENFKKEIDEIPDIINFEGLYNTLYTIMERWTSNVASAGYGTIPDISLFDHLRTVAAYADAKKFADSEIKPFLIIEGDISGIQNFIYRIAQPHESKEKNTAKALRGRSTYVWLLADAIAHYILQTLGLFKVHLLMSGGGHFQIILSNTEENKKKLDEIEREINKWLLKKFGGDLGLVLAVESFSEKEISDFGAVKMTLSQALERRKRKKYFDLLNEDQLFGPFEFDDRKMAVCTMCGADFYKKQENNSICPECETHILIGERLVKTQYILRINGGKCAGAGCETAISFDGFDLSYVLVNSEKEIAGILNKMGEFSGVEIIRLNNTDIMNPYSKQVIKDFKGKTVSLGFQFMGNFVPKDNEGHVISFEELAQGRYKEGKDEKANGTYSYPMLSMLRMDVDSLGGIFAKGFSDKTQSIARIANLSRLMTLFFSGYLNKLAEKNCVYIGYSGGDDLFAVGKWNHIIQFALDVHEDFTRFVCNNPHITISGGIETFRPNFPVRQGAELAGIAEDRAKDGEKELIEQDKYYSGKDALTLFGKTYLWKNMLGYLDWAKQLVDLIGQGETEGLKDTHRIRALLRDVKNIKNKAIDRQGNQRIEWIYQIKHKVHYLLARRVNLTKKALDQEMEKKEANAEKQKEWVQDLSKLLDIHFLKTVELPIDYILLATRDYRK